MLDQNLGIVSTILKIIGGFFALLASLFGFLAVLQNEKHESTKEWFQKMWEKISQSRWLQMPEHVIKVVLKAKKKLTSRVVIFAELCPQWFFWILIILLPGFLDLIWISLVPLIFVLIAIYLEQNNVFRKYYKRSSLLTGKILKAVGKSFSNFWMFILGLFSWAVGIIWVSYKMNSNIIFSSLTILITLLISYICIILPILILVQGHRYSLQIIKRIDDFIVFSLSIGLSFAVTFLSFLLGITISSESHVPKTLQMLISNVLCDGVTVLITFIILEWALKQKTLLRIPVAILMDIVAAAVLACASIYFGLFFTDYQLSLSQVFLVLIGKSPSGLGFEFGPYFWAMHTTFIPTFIYLFFIFVMWIGKLILASVEWFLGKGYEHKNPLALTAALFTLLATGFALSGLATDAIEKHINKDQIMLERKSYLDSQ